MFICVDCHKNDKLVIVTKVCCTTVGSSLDSTGHYPIATRSVFVIARPLAAVAISKQQFLHGTFASAACNT